MPKRFKTDYPGVFYREADRIGGKGKERVYYIVFKKHDEAGRIKVYEEKVGRHNADDMTPAKAARIRGERIENKRPSRKEIREEEQARKDAEAGKWTLGRLFDAYIGTRTEGKGKSTDGYRFKTYLAHLADKEPGEITSLDVDQSG